VGSLCFHPHWWGGGFVGWGGGVGGGLFFLGFVFSVGFWGVLFFCCVGGVFGTIFLGVVFFDFLWVIMFFLGGPPRTWLVFSLGSFLFIGGVSFCLFCLFFWEWFFVFFFFVPFVPLFLFFLLSLLFPFFFFFFFLVFFLFQAAPWTPGSARRLWNRAA